MAGNALRYLFGGSARSWARNLGGAAPALGSMTLLLMVAGLAGLSVYAVHRLADREAADAAVLHVYLRDEAGAGQVEALQLRLEADPRVVAVHYTSKAEALANANQRPGLAGLSGAGDANPFPASFDVKLRDVGQVGAVADSVRGDPAVDPLLGTSFDPGVYGRLQAVMTWVSVAGLVALALLGLVAVMVTANSIRAEIAARREEVTIMQLVGAPRWMVRGPFVVEGALTGAAAGLIAAAATVLVAGAAIAVGVAGDVLLSPSQAALTAAAAGLAVIAGGIVLGSGSSLLGLRRHLET